MQKRTNKELNITSITWNTTSDLYDFENSDSEVVFFNINTSGTLLRENNKIVFKYQGLNLNRLINIDIDKNNNFLLKSPTINYGPLGDNKFNNINYINNINLNNNLEHIPYIVLNSILYESKDEGYKLIEGDIIKLSKLRLKVRKINLENQDTSKKLPEKTLTSNDLSDINKKSCRICYGDSSLGPLISPCKCTGSLQYIHLECLKKWLMTKLHIDNSNQNNKCMKYILNQVECELCKCALPDYYKVNNKNNKIIYDLYNFSNYKNYFILESFITEDFPDRVIYICNLDYLINNVNNEYITIGRDSNCVVKIEHNNSISRLHAKIKFQNNGLYIKDNYSKFGTCVQLQNNCIVLKNYCNIMLQFGKTIIDFYQKNTCCGNFFYNLFCRCCLSCGKDINYYQKQNELGIGNEKYRNIQGFNDFKDENNNTINRLYNNYID